MRNSFYLLGIIILALGLYSIYVTKENNQLERTVHAQYTNELANASEKLTALQRSLSQALIFQDERALTNELDSIWRISNEMRNSIGRLPVQQNVANDWMRYLGKIGEEAKRASVSKDFSEWQNKMTTISSNLDALSEDWNVATSNFFEQDGNYSKWADNLALETEESPFSAVSGNLKSYNETDFPLTASESDYQKKKDLQHIVDREVTKDEALGKFEGVFPKIGNATITVTTSEDDAPYPFYHIQFARGSRLGYADITKKGGHILSFLLERPVKEANISQQEAKQRAEQFMKDAGFKDVTYKEARENHEAWHFVFTRLYNDALVYPDSIQLKLAKDNGEVLGINAMEYVQKEQIKQQAKNPIKWDEFFHPNAVVEEERLIYTENKAYDLRLCYEVIVRLKNDNHDTFRVVIDTENHDVLQVEALS
ncbi:PepSY1/2 domain-containing protein [Lysinibacillus sp. 54212]|uniref:PepSY1/2 domain-containing protein n=1 Tax=Lysinibacillus sp. 54212 TaxID=3119829 RepID=UPI002FC8E31E